MVLSSSFVCLGSVPYTCCCCGSGPWLRCLCGVVVPYWFPASLDDCYSCMLAHAFSIRLWCLLGSVIFSSGWAVYLLPGWPWFWAFGLRCSHSSLAVLSLWCRWLLTVRSFPGCLPQLRGSGFIIQRYLVWDERHRVSGACLSSLGCLFTESFACRYVACLFLCAGFLVSWTPDGCLEV